MDQRLVAEHPAHAGVERLGPVDHEQDPGRRVEPTGRQVSEQAGDDVLFSVSPLTLNLPTVTDAFQGPCDLQQSNKSASHLEVTPGQTFNYFIHVFNQGAEPCSDITVTDTLDSQVSFVSCTDGCTNSGQEVTWSDLDLGGGSGMTLTITVQTADDATGTLSNTAVIDSPDDAGGPHTVTHNGPAVTDQSVLAPPDPARIGNPMGPLPKTGGTNPMLPLAAVGAASLAALVLRRRFSASS